MTTSAGTPDASETRTPGLDLDWRVVRSFAHFASGFWRGEGARRSWMLTGVLAICLLLSTTATVALNHWTRWFFDSLEARDAVARFGSRLQSFS
jgi:ABC-type uncharacterized transport system fused permease/ATPase subunit